MWIVTGNTASGKEASYKIPASRDTDKGHIVGLAYAEHAKGHATDPLDYPSVQVRWTADNVQTVQAYKFATRANYSVEKRVTKGVWERHSIRALRTLESASEALEGAASADPDGKYRVVETFEAKYVVAISKNAKDMVQEVPDEPVQEEIEGPAPKSVASGVAPKAKTTPKAA